jgi:tetratricopeptide (TPR) repeat protein
MQTGTAVSQEPAVLESRVPLSLSLIWRLQSDFYSRRGLKAWTEDGVPSYITSNPFIAEVYAQIVAAFIDDCLGQAPRGPELSPENPLRILELGAGTGKFAYLFLRQLTALLRERGIDAQTVRYCLSDCSGDLLTAWRANPYLAEFATSGALEFELLRAGQKGSSPSLGSSAHRAGKPGESPLVVIANYVFDSLPQDAFTISDGQISEALVTTSTSAHGNPRPGELQLSFSNAPVPPDRYADKPWNGILDHYRNSLPSATVFFPAAALELLHQLGRSSDGRMLVLAADKGLTREGDLALSQGAPELEFHAAGQCFSTIVNFDAIARCFWSAGGEAFLPQKRFSNLSLCAFLQHGPEQDFPATRKAWSEAARAFGPDDLFTLMGWLDSHLEEVSLAQALSILRLTRWDPTALLRLFPVIAPKLRMANAERNDLRDAVRSCRANHYPVSPGDNVLAFNCGVILLELRFYAEAMELLRISQRELGGSAATSYNLGLCASGLGRADEALAFMVEACGLDPAFEPASSARARLESQSKGAET